MKELSIIIVSYKTRDLLEKCLASIFAGEYPFSYRVVVVDNASGDGTPEMVVARYPDALMIDNPTNAGFSAGNNLGIRNSDSKHILLLNPDTEVIPGTITAMVDFLNRHPHVGIVGCRLLNTDGSHQTSWFSFPMPFSRYIEKWRYYPALARFVLGFRSGRPLISEPGVKKVDIVKGACLMIRRETVNQIGLLDENSFLYADDIDWCLRAHRKKWEVYALESHNIIHHGYASTEQEPYITITSSRRSALYLYRKHYPAPFVMIWRLLIYQEILYKWLLNGVRLGLGKKDGKTEQRYRAYRDLIRDAFSRRKQSGSAEVEK